MSESLGNLPTAEQLLVLHAALDPAPAAAVAWQRWRQAIEFDDVDHGSTRLLPLVYRNLGAGAFDEEVAGRLKGLYRRSWSHNQLIFKRAAGAIGVLEGAGIETLVTKGASLALLSYGDVGVRPMDDVDVLVPLDRHRRDRGPERGGLDARSRGSAGLDAGASLARLRRLRPRRGGPALVRALVAGTRRASLALAGATTLALLGGSAPACLRARHAVEPAAAVRLDRRCGDGDPLGRGGAWQLPLHGARALSRRRERAGARSWP